MLPINTINFFSISTISLASLGSAMIGMYLLVCALLPPYTDKIPECPVTWWRKVKWFIVLQVCTRLAILMLAGTFLTIAYYIR